MVTDKKKLGAAILAAVLLVGVLFSAVTSMVTALSVGELKAAAAKVGLVSGETQENDVPIMNGEYMIRATTNISDAYRSSNTAGLSDKDKETLEMASAVLDEIITDKMTPFEKELAVYDWMTTELTYDTGVLQVIPQTQQDCDNPYGVLKYHNAVCVGYATTFRLFMEMLEIPCMVIHNNELYHSWNLVQLDNEWYHVDVYSAAGNGGHSYFNCSDDILGQNWDRDFFPAATGTKYNYAIQKQQPVEDIYTIPTLLRKALEGKQSDLALGFASIDEPHAQIVETMLSTIQSLVETGDYGDLWMSWNWIPVSGSQYVLSVDIYGFQQEEPAQDISEEDQAKIEEAIDKAFGTDLDWEDIENATEEDAEAFVDMMVEGGGG